MAFLIALAVDQDHIVPDIFLQNTADFGVTGTGVEGDGQNQFVPGGQVIGEVEGIEQGMDFVISKGLDQHLALALPVDPGGGVGWDVFLGLSILEKGSEAFQDAVDIAGRQLLFK